MILDLFRQQHENVALFQPPFTTEQVEAMLREIGSGGARGPSRGLLLVKGDGMHIGRICRPCARWPSTPTWP